MASGNKTPATLLTHLVRRMMNLPGNDKEYTHTHAHRKER
jgi:hypothetical protein